MDLDRDFIYDFNIDVFYDYSPVIFLSYFKFKCLTDKAKVLVYDTLTSPMVSSYRDTLNCSGKWVSEEMYMLSAHGESEMAGGDGIIYKEGPWFHVEDKYIGVMIEKEDFKVFGWIKLSVPNDDWIHSLTIHQLAYKKVKCAN